MGDQMHIYAIPTTNMQCWLLSTLHFYHEKVYPLNKNNSRLTAPNNIFHFA